MNSKKYYSVQKFVSEINKKPFVMGEGEKKFQNRGIIESEKVLAQYRDIKHFLKDASLQEKMKIARFLRTGKWLEVPPNFIEKIDNLIKENAFYGAVSVLTEFIGQDTRGVIEKSMELGKHLNIFALEKKIDHSFLNWLNKNTTGGCSWKAGQVFQKLQLFFNKGKEMSSETPSITD